MAGLAAALTIAGTLASGAGTVIGAVNQKNVLNAQAKAVERQGDEQAAAAQRDAIQRQKEAEQVLSRQQAVAAASGGSATDPTVLKLAGDTAAQGAYNAASAVYEGEAAKAGARDQAAIYRLQARQTMLSGLIGAGSTLLNGISGYLRYREQPQSYGGALPTLQTYSAYRTA